MVNAYIANSIKYKDVSEGEMLERVSKTLFPPRPDRCEFRIGETG
jgi:hypothetical protein